MFNLGFTMEELMFPENYRSNLLFHIDSDCSNDKLDEVSSTYDNQEQIIMNSDDDDDWFTIKQLNPDISSNESKISVVNDQILPNTNVYSDNFYFDELKSKSTIEFDEIKLMAEFDEVKSMVDLEGGLMLPNLGRRRRKRTIFSPADIEHLKEAFIENPKPSQQDIAILSEQLGHDSYVIRVWFYNKRQAAKKRS